MRGSFQPVLKGGNEDMSQQGKEDAGRTQGLWEMGKQKQKQPAASSSYGEAHTQTLCHRGLETLWVGMGES